MSGYDATAAIRAREAQTGNHLPIIAMTANAMQGDCDTCLETGMGDSMSKPVASPDLATMVQNAGKVSVWRSWRRGPHPLVS